jgi:P2-related tail formation protein
MQIDNGQIMIGIIAVLLPLCALYFRVRQWEKSLRGEGEKRELVGQPIGITLTEKLVTRADCKETTLALHGRLAVVEEDIRTLRVEHEKARIELNESAENRSSRIHERIDSIAVTTSEIRGELRHLSHFIHTARSHGHCLMPKD